MTWKKPLKTQNLNNIKQCYLTLNSGGFNMVLKTFNVSEDIYKRFSELCKGNGISMSKQIDFFMRSVVEEDPEAKKEYLKKLDKIREGKFIRVDDFAKRYGLK
jgi:hypothetical protein